MSAQTKNEAHYRMCLLRIYTARIPAHSAAAAAERTGSSTGSAVSSRAYAPAAAHSAPAAARPTLQSASPLVRNDSSHWSRKRADIERARRPHRAILEKPGEFKLYGYRIYRMTLRDFVKLEIDIVRFWGIMCILFGRGAKWR